MKKSIRFATVRQDIKQFLGQRHDWRLQAAGEKVFLALFRSLLSDQEEFLFQYTFSVYCSPFGSKNFIYKVQTNGKNVV